MGRTKQEKMTLGVIQEVDIVQGRVCLEIDKWFDLIESVKPVLNHFKPGQTVKLYFREGRVKSIEGIET